jgi:hypothetical protein
MNISAIHGSNACQKKIHIFLTKELDGHLGVWGSPVFVPMRPMELLGWGESDFVFGE